MAHVDFADERRVSLDLARVERIEFLRELAPHLGENLVDGSRAEGALTVGVFVAGQRVELDDADAGSLLTPVVLFLHEEVQTVQGVGVAAVSLLEVRKRLE